MQENVFSDIQFDALREIGNIGIGNAVTSLAEFINRPVNMTVPRAGFYPYEAIIEMIGGYEELISCVSVRIEGDVPGMVLFIFDNASTLKLIDMLMGLEEGTTVELDEMGMSAIQEVGNILTGSFINALSLMTGLEMVPSVPVFAFDMLAAVLTSLLVASGRVDDKVLAIETELFQDTHQVKGHFFLLTEPGSVEKLLKALGL